MDATLLTLRRRIERLASPDGGYRVVSVETGNSPVPVNGLRFSSRSRGATAALLAQSYRRSLRQWDPRTPTHELVVEEVPVNRGPDVAVPGTDQPPRSEHSL